MPNLLQVKGLSKTYSLQLIFDQADFCVGERQKIAVIGRNGAGKSTLFRIITGQEQADNGEVIFDSSTRLGYLQQEDNFQADDTVMSYLQRESGKEDWECGKVAAQFDLKNELLEKKITDLSGGYQMRVKLTQMLLHNPNLILLDEPTNFLDLSTMLLLEKFLKGYRGSYMVISHDRRFISNTCNEILEIERGKTYFFPNTLENYVEFKKQKVLSAEKFNQKQEEKREHLQRFIDRFGAKASLATAAHNKEKQLARLQTIEIEAPLPEVYIRVPQARTTSGFCWRLEDLAIGYPSATAGNAPKTIANNIALDIDKCEHVAVLGDNGQGKSTFLKTLAEEILPLEGKFKKAQDLQIAYYAQHTTMFLDPNQTVVGYLEQEADKSYNSEDIQHLAANFLFREDDLGKKIAMLSGGEKSRLCLAGILSNVHDVILLDEPTNHLDFVTAEKLARALKKSKATIVFISHDRTFISIVADKILEARDGRVKQFHGNFNEYIEHLEAQSVVADPIAAKAVINESVEQEKARRREIFERNKAVRRELSKVEAKLAQFNKEKESILQKFKDHPTAPQVEWSVRLKEVEEQIVKFEADWLAVSGKIEK